MPELDPKPDAKSALERIRERKLVQWGLAYAAGAWVVLEVATLVGEHFGWPVWIGRALIALAVGGLPVALVLAWYHGERGRQRASGPELLMLAALLLVAGAAVTLVTRSGVTEASRPVGEEGARPTGAAEASGGIGTTGASALLPPDAPDARYSIAVLPFTSLSPDGEDDYFADAVTEEILNALAKLQGLRVISRTSVMRYKQTGKRLPEIAAELGVSKVLEGSVQRQGDRIRIIAQLVDARTDAHLWSDAYERQVSNLFQVQVEIAGEIADALQTELTPAERERIEAGRTGELTAYDLYLRAREMVQTEFSDPEALRRAIRLLRRALEIDPDYARAHAGLAEALVVLQPFEGPRLGDTARAHARRSVELEPELAEAHSAHCRVLFWNGRLEDALPSCRRAVELQPSLAEAVENTGLILEELGRLDEAVPWLMRATVLDPGVPRYHGNLGGIWEVLGDSARAHRSFEERLRLAPDDPHSYSNFHGLYLGLGHLESAARELRRLETIAPGTHVTLWARARLAMARGQWGEAVDAWEAYHRVVSADWDPPIRLAFAHARAGNEEAADSLARETEANAVEWREEQHWWADLTLAQVSVLRGEHRRALEYLERAHRLGYLNPTELRTDPLMAPLRDARGFRDLLARMEKEVDRMRAAAVRHAAD